MFDNFMKWYESIWGHQGQVDAAVRTINAAMTPETLDNYFNSLSDALRQDEAVQKAFMHRTEEVQGIKTEFRDPFAKFIDQALTKWVSAVGDLENLSPEEQSKRLADITAKVLEMTAASAVIDVGLGLLPNSAGEASAMNSKQLLRWLGFGAVLAAVAHDPVKIGLLRPYQDSLEAKFHNKRPELGDLLKSFEQRSLSQTTVTDTDQITDSLMDQIELENDTTLKKELAKHGYNEWYISVLEDAATKTLNFGQLTGLARMGYYNRGMATFSLWGMGLDRRLMSVALDTIETVSKRSNYEGFRSLIEPSYVSGDITADDLTQYWNKIGVPADVQAWTLPRLTKSREKALLALSLSDPAKCKTLSAYEAAQAYKNSIITAAEYQARLEALKYCNLDIGILIKLNAPGTATAAATKLKHLSLTDYEKAHKNEIITADQVLARLAEEYAPLDIEIEKQFLALDDLEKEVITAEKDLTSSQISAAYAAGLITKDEATTHFKTMGFDDSETAILLELADLKKKLPKAGGLKRLPLSDYEKAWKNSLLTDTQVLDRMRGEYQDQDIQLEQLLLSIGKP